LVPGKYADLTLLSDDVFTLAPEKVKDVRAVWTMVGGKEVWKGF
jgi:predicted amidohydrolase YtcJ